MPAFGPTKVICMVTEVSPSHNLIHVSMLDGTQMRNGKLDMTLEGVAEKLSGTGKKVVKGKFDHKRIPRGGDLVEITYYPTKDEAYDGVEWKWANQMVPR